MTVADFIINFLQKNGVKSIFMVTGGQAMFLNDAVFKSDIKPIYHHHEQAASMAAEAYSRITRRPGVVMVTAGPGGINALNGVVGGWVDSSPMIVISGQSNRSASRYMESHSIRQFGTQGINIESFVKNATKVFITVDDPADISRIMEEAFFKATTGRTGPAWVNVPLDVQRMELPRKLNHFKIPASPKSKSDVATSNRKLVSLIQNSHRPLLIVGQGVRISRAEKELYKLLKLWQPVVMTTRLGIDLIDSSSELFNGRPGLYGDRYSNINVQNADLIVVLGARMDTGITGYDPDGWGKNAKIVYVDIDKEEIRKPGIKIYLKINSDLSDFLPQINKLLSGIKIPEHQEWIDFCKKLKRKYPTTLSEYKKEKKVNSYHLSSRLSYFAGNNDMVVVDTSSAFHVVCQAWEIKLGQRFLTTGGISTMGYWPAGIGVSMTNLKKRTIIITGDGSLQMNLQELATLKQNNLPIKLFILNNNGYLLIRHTQAIHFESRLMGESPETGLFIPDSIKLAKAYGIKGIRIANTREVDVKIQQVLAYPGPVICDVLSPEWQMIIPRVSSKKMPDGKMVSRPYEDMFPFLDEHELSSNLLSPRNE